MRHAWILALAVTASLSSHPRAHARVRSSQALRLEKRARHERETRRHPGRRKAPLRLRVARDPFLASFERLLEEQERKDQKAARRTYGLLRQRLRIAKLPRSVKAEVGRFFAEAHQLKLTLHEGRSASLGPVGRSMTLVYLGETDTRHEISLVVGHEGVDPRLVLRRRSGSPAMQSEIRFEPRNGILYRDISTNVVGEDGQWRSDRVTTRRRIL